MKTEIIRDGIVVEPSIAPIDEDLRETLGRSFPILNDALANLRAMHPEIEPEWRFSNRAGWYQTWLLHGRRVLNLLPEHGHFEINIVLNAAELALLEKMHDSVKLSRLLSYASHGPDGTTFTFAADDFDLEIVLALFEAKITA